MRDNDSSGKIMAVRKSENCYKKKCRNRRDWNYGSTKSVWYLWNEFCMISRQSRNRLLSTKLPHCVRIIAFSVRSYAMLTSWRHSGSVYERKENALRFRSTSNVDSNGIELSVTWTYQVEQFAPDKVWLCITCLWSFQLSTPFFRVRLTPSTLSINLLQSRIFYPRLLEFMLQMCQDRQ